MGNQYNKKWKGQKHEVNFSMRLSYEEDYMLDAVANAIGCSKSDVVRRGIAIMFRDYVGDPE